MALEASLVLPLFLFVLLFFIFLIRMAVVQMALQDVASQAARQAAAHMRPAALAAAAEDSERQASSPQPPLAGIGSVAGQLAGMMPEPAGPLIEAVLEGDWRPVQDMAGTAVADRLARPLIGRLAEPSVLDADRIRVAKLSLPDLNGGPQPYFRLELAYEFPLGLPFTKRTVSVSAAAEERVWIGDDIPAASDDGSADDADDYAVTILAIEPTPLRPGRKARLVAAAAPHETVKLEVRYKSGASKAKHLGEATADENGLVEWEWHVSGNTTPGVWELTVEAANGARQSMHFKVEKSGAKGE